MAHCNNASDAQVSVQKASWSTAATVPAPPSKLLLALPQEAQLRHPQAAAPIATFQLPLLLIVRGSLAAAAQHTIASVTKLCPRNCQNKQSHFM
jgi:hypothetical protein